MAPVILVAGPPCAGKNHYVDQHRTPGDVVLDQDAIGPQAFNAAVAQLEHERPGARTWVIRCCGGATARARFAERIHASDVVLLTPPEDVLLARARQRPQPHRHAKAVRYWLDQEARDPAPEPQPRPMTRW
ncbi:hypothetical protein [Amycolatopsis thermoflava]|uniref:hypothetical protein n=1 Tax=Amycolatopsis thermoflava TaxID=84480 RepID=UPI003F4A4CCF